ncbi:MULTISPECIES: phosphoglycerate dehydrogenase [unclassified Adlercreutzia]|uniref:phosphoglycerate dehydrogenase n=1 Tax=unclassified Adlercreutzia TaxID=2636013 RepID=UPI0013ED35F7|nr:MULTISPECIES: phosphoglycerate dehydrogenase [unclassified Adlercreutzia]
MTKKILITEKIADEGIDILRRRGFQVDEKLELSSEQLVEQIGEYDALIVRSATHVTSQVIDAAKNLKIIGRAGVTVDNIDIDAANSHGIVVCNAPTSNIISAAEFAMAMLLSSVRKIPQANASMHSGKWDRRDFMGSELYGKTLAIFGLGRVGSLVAERAKAFGMNLIAYDPYCSPDRAMQLDVTLFNSVEDVLPRADFITLHLPKTEETVGMFGPKEFAAMKNGVVLINCARASILNMDSLADFVAAGKISAAAIDIFPEEPCYSSPLHELPNAILTPHVNAVTKEAQVRAGEQIAEYVWAGLEGSIVPTAINATGLPPEVMDRLRPYMPACRMVGRMASSILKRIPKRLLVQLEGRIADADPDMLVAGVVDGILSYKQVGSAMPDNARLMAERHGMKVETHSCDDAQEFASAVRIKADGVEIAATLYGIDMLPRIISLMGYKIDIAPAAQSLAFEYIDAPGRVGIIGTILGAADVNITTMQIGTKSEEKCALVYMNVEGEVTDAVLNELRESIDLKNLWHIRL